VITGNRGNIYVHSSKIADMSFTNATRILMFRAWYDTVKDWRPNRLGVYGTRSYVPAFYSHVSGNHLRFHSFAVAYAIDRCMDLSGPLATGR
jgi:hypothetical protein